jgi:hypothetical protein
MKTVRKRIAQCNPFLYRLFRLKKKEAFFEKYWKKLYNVKVWSDFEISF